jgi:hypothetical protein
MYLIFTIVISEAETVMSCTYFCITVPLMRHFKEYYGCCNHAFFHTYPGILRRKEILSEIQ